MHAAPRPHHPVQRLHCRPLPCPSHAQVVDLDRGLTASQKAEAAAFAALVEAKLHPALMYTTWVEGDAFAQHTRSAYGAGLPFPLSFFIPRAQRKAVQAHFAGTTAAQVRACEGGWMPGEGWLIAGLPRGCLC